jgi:DNA-binding transcriptional LysR family regulator
MAVFVAVADTGSFAEAARRLGSSPPAVTRAVIALEGHLGMRLLNRTTRTVRLTEAGMRYLEDARRILGEIDEMEEAAAGINAEPRGRLSVTAPVLFGKMFVVPIIVDFLQAHRQVEVSGLFLDRVVNLVEEGLDVAVRIGHLPSSTMLALKVGQVNSVLCAAPDYLARHGTPQAPADLAAHTIIASTRTTPTNEWRFPSEKETLAVRVQPRLTVSSNDAAIEAALAGFGIVRLLSYQVAPQLATGRLVRLLAGYETAPLPVHVVHREDRRSAGKVRAFVDFTSARLRADAFLNPASSRSPAT